ncbi:MAG: hypothetical protein B7733_23015 [Myxococcales bacterium FL481]|nr:MAG: hypothetical protein B7733_23015 [Myxococcales bacterium FL481]
MTDEPDIAPLSARARALLDVYRANESLPKDVERRVGRVVLPIGRRTRVRTMLFVGAAATALAAALLITFTRPSAQRRPHPANAATLDQLRGQPSRDANVRAAGKPNASPSVRSRVAAPDPAPAPPRAAPSTPLGTSLPDKPSPRRVATRSKRQPPPIESGAAAPRRAQASPATTSGLAREQAALNLASDSLARRDYRGASEALDRYRRQFPKGVLKDEANALNVMVECLQSPSKADRLLAQFERSHPRSLLLTRVRQACRTDRNHAPPQPTE